MKKFYVAPEMEVEMVELESPLCTGSVWDKVPTAGGAEDLGGSDPDF